MSFLKYYQGANPGKKRKIATLSEEEKKFEIDVINTCILFEL
jgi:hypothetical protein